MYTSEFTVEQLIEMLQKMPKEAKLFIDYEGYYKGAGGPVEPKLLENGVVLIGELSASY